MHLNTDQICANPGTLKFTSVRQPAVFFAEADFKSTAEENSCRKMTVTIKHSSVFQNVVVL